MAGEAWFERHEKPVVVLGTIFGLLLMGATLYFTVAPLFHWWPVAQKEAAVTPAGAQIIPLPALWALGVLGALILVACWRARKPTKALFYENRKSLHDAHGSLGGRLAKIKTASAMLANGLAFYAAEVNTDRIKRLLLPDPNGEGFKFHMGTTAHKAQDEAVREATRLAKRAGARVRWYDHFVHHSVVLADVDQAHGWIQIESTLPTRIRANAPATQFTDETRLTR